jgi:hypothetical protein
MMGTPKSWAGKVFGPTGQYVNFIWRYVAPLEAVVCFLESGFWT